MFFSLKKQIFCNCQRVEGLQKTLHYLETWALRAVLTPSRSLLLLLLLWPPLPPYRDLQLLGQQDHPPLSPAFVDTQKHGCYWLPLYPLLLPPPLTFPLHPSTPSSP